MDIDRQVEIFKEAILNIVSNFILNKVITLGNWETKWLNDDIKIKIKKKTMLMRSMFKIPMILLHFPTS